MKCKLITIDSRFDDVKFLDDDECYYLREYTVDKNYQFSETNNLISNFKKTPEEISNNQWILPHKKNAIKQFVNEIFPHISNDISICRIPSSKRFDDKYFDSRLDDVLKLLKKKKPSIRIENPVKLKETVQASHLGGIRDPEIIKQNYIWCGFKSKSESICLVDDLITSGAHFKAMKNMILEHKPNTKVVGIFWAKAIE